ncbi:hypothetical protein CCFV1_ORF084 [Cotesia congregata filamentous virus 1]|uniref:Uncharacterized protein n=1 Tax=Cotesia congregata filamentous virus 1 TaxID=3064291 RepID=A0ABC8QKA6_9VIRU|nr:hypothetical protein CCFV1_ORF084 [Cotesia congregata filamentous virus 1]
MTASEETLVEFKRRLDVESAKLDHFNSTLNVPYYYIDNNNVQVSSRNVVLMSNLLQEHSVLDKKIAIFSGEVAALQNLLIQKRLSNVDYEYTRVPYASFITHIKQLMYLMENKQFIFNHNEPPFDSVSSHKDPFILCVFYLNLIKKLLPTLTVLPPTLRMSDLLSSEKDELFSTMYDTCKRVSFRALSKQFPCVLSLPTTT